MDLRHILAGADESGAGRDAVRSALALARRSSARVTVLRAVMASAAVGEWGATGDPWPTGAPGSSEVVRLQRWLASDLLDLEGLPPVDFDIGFGIPGIEICRYAEQTTVDLIVIGRKKRSQTARLLVGDTADAVARRSRVPCLFVPSADYEVRRMLVALDGTERGMAVLRQACEFAKNIGATLRVITVEPARSDEPHHLALTLPAGRTVSLEIRARELVKRSGLPLVGFQVCRGDVVRCILGAVEESGTDTLVIGCHRGGPPGILEAGSNARRLLHTAPCAVMTIPL
jgi:nucleotide-binding universal stress UspA family protein